MRNGHGTVLVAYDGSPEAQRALREAAVFVRAGWRLAVVNVIPAQSVGSRLVTVGEEQEELQRHVLAEAGRLLANEGLEAVPVAAAGDPLTEILAAAERLDARLVAVGGQRHRFRHGIGDRLVRRAGCDVLVVR
jgi:nucleotide-binding universal stress UspA family protein